MSEETVFTYLGQQRSAKGAYTVGGLKVVLPTGEESCHEVRIHHRARDKLESERGRPLTPQDIDILLECWGKERVRNLLGARRPFPPVLRLDSRAVAGIEAQLLLKRCGLL